MFQLDIKDTFLYGDVIKEECIQQASGYFAQGEKMVYKLERQLYGQKQGPWTFLVSNGSSNHLFSERNKHGESSLFFILYQVKYFTSFTTYSDQTVHTHIEDLAVCLYFSVHSKLGITNLYNFSSESVYFSCDLVVEFAY